MLGMTENNSPLRSFIVFVPPRCQAPVSVPRIENKEIRLTLYQSHGPPLQLVF